MKHKEPPVVQWTFSQWCTNKQYQLSHMTAIEGAMAWEAYRSNSKVEHPGRDEARELNTQEFLRRRVEGPAGVPPGEALKALAFQEPSLQLQDVLKALSLPPRPEMQPLLLKAAGRLDSSNNQELATRVRRVYHFLNRQLEAGTITDEIIKGAIQECLK